MGEIKSQNTYLPWVSEGDLLNKWPETENTTRQKQADYDFKSYKFQKHENKPVQPRQNKGGGSATCDSKYRLTGQAGGISKSEATSSFSVPFAYFLDHFFERTLGLGPK